jgi:hypothetical protein
MATSKTPTALEELEPLLDDVSQIGKPYEFLHFAGWQNTLIDVDLDYRSERINLCSRNKKFDPVCLCPVIQKSEKAESAHLKIGCAPSIKILPPEEREARVQERISCAIYQSRILPKQPNNTKHQCAVYIPVIYTISNR